MNTKKLGNFGEERTVKYLRRKGYKILERNFFMRASAGPKIAEIDIIAKKSDIFVFAEVKTIEHYPKLYYLPQDKVNQQKLWKISKAAETWFMKNKIIPYKVKWQIDVITVEVFPNARHKIIETLFGPKTKISHFPNVSA